VFCGSISVDIQSVVLFECHRILLSLCDRFAMTVLNVLTIRQALRLVSVGRSTFKPSLLLTRSHDVCKIILTVVQFDEDVQLDSIIIDGGTICEAVRRGLL